MELDGQYRALKEGAAVVDRSARGKLLVRGRDGAEYLQGQLTNDVEALEPGPAATPRCSTARGAMQADMRVLRLDPGDLWLDRSPRPPPRCCAISHVQRRAGGGDRGRHGRLVDPVGHRPGGGGGGGHRTPAAEYAQRRYGREGVEILAVATDLGVDLFVRVDQADELRRRSPARRPWR